MAYGNLTGQELQKDVSELIYTADVGKYSMISVFVVNQGEAESTFTLSICDIVCVDPGSIVENKKSLAANGTYRIDNLIIGSNQKLIAHADEVGFSIMVMGHEREI